ncbi:hypothetical protein VTN02DRAFT_6820 [Thermoascus thermophilus]
MLSAPAKSAKRISSLFSLGSAKDNGSSASPSASPRLKSVPDHAGHDRTRSNSRTTRRHVSSPQVLSSETRPVQQQQQPPPPQTPGALDDLDLNAPLPPPPSLLAVNQDLADTAGNAPDARPQSRGRSRPSSSAGGLAPPGSAPIPRPGTPSDSNKASRRRSWMPGRSRASSVDHRANHAGSQMPSAWVAGLDQKVPYDIGPLLRGEPVRSMPLLHVQRR